MSAAKLEDWVRAPVAHEIVKRSRRTVYRWIATGRVRTMQPGTVTWVYVPDLLEVEALTVRRITRVDA